MSVTRFTHISELFDTCYFVFCRYEDKYYWEVPSDSEEEHHHKIDHVPPHNIVPVAPPPVPEADAGVQDDVADVGAAAAMATT